MIDQIFLFLKKGLNTYLASGKKPSELQEDQVVFSERKNSEVISFQTGKISILLVNLEQEKVLRAEDPFMKTMPDGTIHKGNPDVRLNLYMLFVSYYAEYADSLKNLSAVIQYFQSQRVLNPENSPELSEGVDQLTIELVALSLAEQNELWSALRLPYHPSVLYKVRSIVYRDEDLTPPSSIVKERVVEISE